MHYLYIYFSRNKDQLKKINYISVNLDYQKLNSTLAADRKRYKDSDPYPHIVIDDFFESTFASKVLDVFPSIKDKGWIHYIHVNEKKHGLNKLDLIPDFIRNQVLMEFNSPPFITYLESLTGIKNLQADHTFEGGGIHQTERHGFLNIHADFTVHPHKKNWKRRVNLLLYLNKDWKESYKGHLELWDSSMTACEQKIAPIFNRVVIFNTDKDSYHGVPDPLNCPEGETRKSIALYYFTKETSGSFKKRATNYRARPNDGYKSILIWLDKKAIAVYSWLKGTIGINDDFASSILNIFRKNK